MLLLSEGVVPTSSILGISGVSPASLTYPGIYTQTQALAEQHPVGEGFRPSQNCVYVTRPVSAHPLGAT